MSQTAITLAFEQWKASQAVTGEPVLLDEFVFANVPGLDASKPIDRSETLPPAAQIVHRQAVSRKGVVNENAVVHSVVLGAEVGDFSFNWIGLINKASNTLAMIVHAPLQQKLKTKDGQQGNVLTRSFLMEYNAAQAETGINTPAETWQIDFTARMAGMDERQRLENIDLYGAAAFLGNGYLVAKSGSQYFVTAGAGYVRGLRAQLAANQNITVTTTPVKVWLDVAWTGTLTSAWGVASKITVAATLADYVQNGVQHYVFAVASIDANGNITDLRPKGTLNDQAASDALKKHEQSRNHPDATTAAKGFTQLSSALDSVSETLAATPKAVKAANDNANGRVPSGRKVNGRALSTDISITAQDIFNGQTVGIGGEADLNTFTTPGLYYQPANAQAQTGKNYPEAVAGSLEVYKHAGITQVYRVYNNSRSYIRTLYSSTWSGWIKQYDAGNKPTPAEIGALASNGNAVSATKLQTARTIGGVAFDGTANINLPGVNAAGNQSTTGNAATATKLQTARTIGGVAFDGTANINLPGVNAAGNQNTSGNAASATKLQTARTIAGVSFNGTANIAIPAGNVGAYTKAECDARYGVMNGFRRGGQQIYNGSYNWIGDWEAPAGCFVTGLKAASASDGRKMAVIYRQMQYLNKQTNAWVAVGD
ncbi:tail fiber protein [Enterobacter hormaechei]|uniref:phage tail-collar fiber domain-containing protein n=2 Tax=Enterobacter hormaechei TaxID=158836 RepID=UPI00125A04FF|nr:phage tail protein [Enterobacter hormaechei]VAG31409.1 tail fiber protein [Enterobacter hormaechei]